MCNKLILCATVGLAGLFCHAGIAEEQSGEKPNILFIMVDDLSPKAIGYKDGYDFLQTPNINRLAQEGAVFEHMYASTSLCSPSRASMLTGTYAHTHGVRYNSQVDYDMRLPSFPLVLQTNGYRTALIGKWHMAHGDEPRPGFDYWLSFEGQGVYTDPVLNENGTRSLVKGYITDILTEKTKAFIKDTSDQPFSICLWHKANHEPFLPAVRHANSFPNAHLDQPVSWTDTLGGKPKWLRRMLLYGPHHDAWKKSEGLPVPDTLPLQNWSVWDDDPRWLNHLRCMLAVDEGVGEVVALLEELGKLDNTMIIFTADNGFMLGEHRRDDKRMAYEESMQIPFCVRYPKEIKAGTVVSNFCLNIDLAPSLLDFCDVSIPDTMQGESFCPLFKNPNTPWREYVFYEYFQEEYAPGIPTMLAVRSRDWKYIEYPYENDVNELYCMQKDPDELNNRIGDPEAATVVRQMKDRLKESQEKYQYTEPDYKYGE